MRRDDSYISDQWADYQRRVRWFMAATVAFIPSFALLILALQYEYGLMGALTLFAVSLLCVVVATLRLQFFPCPNCGKPSAFKYVNHLPIFVSACKHCGLPKWEH